MRDYVEGLAASQRSGEERRVVWIGDSGQAGTDVYWCEPVSEWLAVDLDNLEAPLKRAEEIVLVQLSCDADPGPIEGAMLARDCESEDGLWIVDSKALDSLQGLYGAALRVIWKSGRAVGSAWRADRPHRTGYQPRVAASRVVD
jgi:hypothetical protein